MWFIVVKGMFSLRWVRVTLENYHLNRVHDNSCFQKLNIFLGIYCTVLSLNQHEQICLRRVSTFSHWCHCRCRLLLRVPHQGLHIVWKWWVLAHVSSSLCGCSTIPPPWLLVLLLSLFGSAYIANGLLLFSPLKVLQRGISLCLYPFTGGLRSG